MMINIFRKTLTKYLLVLVLFAQGLLQCPALANSSHNAHPQSASKSLKAIERKKISTHRKIIVLKRKEKVEIKKLYKSQIKLEQASKDLNSSANRLTATKKHLDRIEQDLTVTIDGYAQVKKSASDRLVSIYKGSYLSFLSVIFQSQDVNNIIDTMYFQKKLVERDRSVINQMQLKAKKLAELKNNKEREQVNLVYTINNINKRKRQIAESITTSQNLIQKLRTDRATYERAEIELERQSESITRFLQKNRTTTNYTCSAAFIRPISGHITSPFGWRVHPIFKSRKFHTGVDIAGPNHGSVRVANTGRVIFAGWYGGYGKVVIVDHGQVGGRSVTTLYAHLSSYSVGKGSMVEKGQVIGREGSTGYSTGPHCHFEVRVNGRPVNPLHYI
jgi:murein DD-endopeptidase MepM/ murein hydrolase activator NlpD